MKLCSRCGEKKQDTEFWKNKRLKRGLQCYCIACCKKYDANRHKKKDKKVEFTPERKAKALAWLNEMLRLKLRNELVRSERRIMKAATQPYQQDRKAYDPLKNMV